ncbi:MAG TPA: class I SAM-dependent methyltransferase [Thermoanaerobaculia bacterium]
MKRIRGIRTITLLPLVAAAAFVALARRSPETASRQEATTPSKTKEPEVPYVATREDVMNEMLRLAAVTKTDIVYDLGCGDGRIVITAAKEFGARGVGIDIDPRRIAESNENARKAGVTDRVQFIEGDLFDADLREATVVTLYLLPSVNMRLRPKLFRELEAGTRVVSHNYDMGDWKPVTQTQIGDHKIYLWTVPPGGKLSVQ